MAQVPDHFAGSPPGGCSHRVKIAGRPEGNDGAPGGDYRIEDLKNALSEAIELLQWFRDEFIADLDAPEINNLDIRIRSLFTELQP